MAGPIASGRIVRAGLESLAVAVIAAIVCAQRIAFRVPWGVDPGPGVQWSVAALGSAILLALLVVRLRRTRGRATAVEAFTL
ncbi:MAG TPA: hypothetical protein VKA53_04380 [Thermoanaerobaculia bacterium]|nr:hypothetical protein [Thermoanaerobaculia bacterium]